MMIIQHDELVVPRDFGAFDGLGLSMVDYVSKIFHFSYGAFRAMG
jgi:hypothetical protein